mgnify:CR=1 FL=1
MTTHQTTPRFCLKTKPAADQKEFATTEQLANRWESTARSIQSNRSRADDHPKYFKCGGRILYRLTDIIAYENKHSVGGEV